MKRASLFMMICLIAASMLGCVASLSGKWPVGAGDDTIAGYEVANESVLRSIPTQYIDYARNNFHIAYEHSSHGTHIAYGLYGLKDYKAGDNTLYAVYDDPAPVAGKLHIYDYAPISSSYGDLSVANRNWPLWVSECRSWIENDSNEVFNILIWSWCNIAGADTAQYLSSMQTLIDEFGAGGSKIGLTRQNPITFIFMTGHADSEGNNIDKAGNQPAAQASEIVEYCKAHGYYCIDYYSIDTHTVDGVYYSDANDNGESPTYVAEYNATHAVPSSGSFFRDWQDSHTLGESWYYSKNSAHSWGVVKVGAHCEDPDQYITANRKAYAFWWLLSRIAGWEG